MRFIYSFFKTLLKVQPELSNMTFVSSFSSLRFKNVMFDISPTEEVGDFEVKAKFMGVEMEKVQLHFQVNISQKCWEFHERPTSQSSVSLWQMVVSCFCLCGSWQEVSWKIWLLFSNKFCILCPGSSAASVRRRGRHEDVW